MTESENFWNRSELLSVTENENYYKGSVNESTAV